MKNRISSTNVSFNYLAQSPDFLNLVLNNINNCVLLLDRHMKLQAFNDALRTIFSNRKDEHLLYKRCGEAIGCAHTVEEMKECGKTSQCSQCKLREAALLSYTEKVEVFKEHIICNFYRVDGVKVSKHLQFSTRSFYFENDYYILVIINDISPIIEQQQKLQVQEEMIKNQHFH